MGAHTHTQIQKNSYNYNHLLAYCDESKLNSSTRIK